MKVISLHNNNIELIKKATRHNRMAQQILYETHAPKMLSVCRYYVKDLQKAEEVMLNGFFKAFTNLKNFKNEGSFEGWLRKIMVREAISFLRQVKNIEFSVDEYLEPPQGNNIESEIELDALQGYIDDLPEGYKVVFVMYVIEGYKHTEIADLLNISVGTSKSQLFKARQILQGRIQQTNKVSHDTK